MLVLTRKMDEQILIGDDVKITLLRVRGNSVRIGIEAPRDVRVVRSELKQLAPQLDPAAVADERPETQPDAASSDSSSHSVAQPADAKLLATAKPFATPKTRRSEKALPESQGINRVTGKLGHSGPSSAGAETEAGDSAAPRQLFVGAVRRDGQKLALRRSPLGSFMGVR